MTAQFMTSDEARVWVDYRNIRGALRACRVAMCDCEDSRLGAQYETLERECMRTLAAIAREARHRGISVRALKARWQKFGAKT